MSDSFIDRPTISALGNALGLGDMFDAARNSDAAAMLAPPTPEDPQQAGGAAPKPAASKPNIPEYKARPYIPRNETTGGVKPGPAGANPIAPIGMDPATLQDPNVQSLLGQYGVHPSTTPPDPNLFLRNPKAFANHPILSGLLERGLEGLAYAHPGNNFFDSLTGGVRGMQEANAARAQQVNAQLMSPINQAAAIQQLQSKYDEHLKSQDDIAYHQGMLKYYQNLGDTKASAEQDRQNHYLDIPPRMNSETGEMMTLQPDDKSPTGSSWKPAPELGRDEVKYQRSKYVADAIQHIADQKYGGDATKVTPIEHLGVLTGLEQAESMAKGASTQAVGKGHDAARVNASGSKGTGAAKLSPAQKDQINQLQTEDRQLDAEARRVQGDGYTGVTLDTGEHIASQRSKSAYLQRIQSRRNAIRQQRNTITGATSAPSAPTYSKDNPFATAPTGK